MITERIANALSSAVYVAKAGMPADMTDDQKLRASGLYADWEAGNHVVGEVYNASGQTWECYQAYNNAVYPDIIPDSTSWLTFNRPLHGTSPETARPWVTPTHSMDIYKTGEYMIWTDGTLQHCKRDSSFGPDYDAGAWEGVRYALVGV